MIIKLLYGLIKFKNTSIKYDFINSTSIDINYPLVSNSFLLTKSRPTEALLANL